MATIPTAEFYSELGLQYESVFGHDSGLLTFIQAALARLPTHARVLDVGCGTGKPVSSTLAATGHQVHGIDISEAMIELSRSQVPLGSFEVANMLHYEPVEKFNGIFAVLSLFLLSREEMQVMAGKWAEWLLSDGLLFICTMLAEDCPQTAAEMYSPDGQCASGIEFLFMGKKVLLTLLTKEGWEVGLKEAGFEIVHTQKDLFVPPPYAESEEEVHYFITARKAPNP